MKCYYDEFDKCIQGEIPFCSAACPFHLDVIDFLDKLSRKNYNAAYKSYCDATGFPRIAAEICGEYCRDVCAREQTGGAVELNLLEKLCVDRAEKKEYRQSAVPKKREKIAIIGAGISGLGCALRLASKKYSVAIYEKSNRIGGQLFELLQAKNYFEEINSRFKNEQVAILYNTEICGIDELLAKEDYGAVYIATGQGGKRFGLCADFSSGKGFCRIVGKTGLFIGGSLLGYDSAKALACGLDMAAAIEHFLKTGGLTYPSLNARETKCYVDTAKLHYAARAVTSLQATDAEILAETERCIRCKCELCRSYCDLAAYTKKPPTKMRDEVMATLSSTTSILRPSPAKRLINMCTQCDICGELCPEGIAMSEMFNRARYLLHGMNKMPPEFHRFWLDDMSFSCGEAALVRGAPNGGVCERAFFPGCQLGASDPRYVLEAYDWLLKEEGAPGIMLTCCSIPSAWAGNEKLHNQAIAALRDQWRSLGCPELIMACPSCQKHFTEFLPEIKTISLYELLAKRGGFAKGEWGTYTLFDPCAAKKQEGVSKSVQMLAKSSGMTLDILADGERIGCCGYGGNIAGASPQEAEFIAQRRLALSSYPYITYCANCRDTFLQRGKPALHILDVLFRLNADSAVAPNAEERRKNRLYLKRTLLQRYWDETLPEAERAYTLFIDDAVRVKMDSLRVLEQDVELALDIGEKRGRRIYDEETDSYICYRAVKSVTFWVQYKPERQGYRILNVYTHRLKIELEQIWNGKKVDL